MQGVVVIFPDAVTLHEIFRDIPSCINLDVRSPQEVFIERDESHAFFIRDNNLISEFCAEEIKIVLGVVSDPVFYSLEFNYIEFAKELLFYIADREDCVVDDDHSQTLRGSEFVDRLRDDPDWDWRV